MMAMPSKKSAPTSMVIGNGNRIKPGTRVRTALCVTWPESQPTELMDRLVESSGIEAARSPLHDRDEYDRTDVEKWLERHDLAYDRFWSTDRLHEQIRAYAQHLGAPVPWIGDAKKPHHHWVLELGGMKSYEQLLDVFGGMVTYFEKPVSKRGSLKYLIHKGRPTKAQYDFNDIRVFGGMDVSCIVKIDDIEVLDLDDYIKDHIRESNCRTYYELCEWAKATKDYNIRHLVRNQGRLYVAYMDSYRYAKELRRREADEREFQALTNTTLDGRRYDPETGELYETAETENV